MFHSTETHTNNSIMSKILSQIESLYKKKESNENQCISDENKNYSIKVQLTPENMLNIVPIKTKQKNKNSIDNLLDSLTTGKKTLVDDLNNSDNFLQERVSILLNGKKPKEDQVISKKNSMMSVLLNKSKSYDIDTTVDV